MISRARRTLFALALAITAVGCDDGDVVVIADAPDRLFVTWELNSASFGPVGCPGGSTVIMDAFDLRSSDRVSTAFACTAFQGTSIAVPSSELDVVLDLTDVFGTVLSEARLRANTEFTTGTLDLGHVVFTLP
jgi:hypothetical protein